MGFARCLGSCLLAHWSSALAGCYLILAWMQGQGLLGGASLVKQYTSYANIIHFFYPEPITLG